MDFSLPRGMRDISPEEFRGTEIVRAAFFETCKLFDYKPMEPSTIELLETLEAKSGAGIRDEIYFFKDKSERDVGLRFDLTVGITRYVCAKRELGPPVRLGCFGSMWRYDEPQYGRYRWFYQWDAELFGPSSAEADAEIIEFTASLFKRIGANTRISIGSRKVVESIIRKGGITEEDRILDTLRAIDKLSKKPIDEIAKEYSRSISKEQLEDVVRFAGIKGEPEKVTKELSANKIDASGLLEIVDSLKSRGLHDVELNMGIVRGLDYYTDMVFEAYDRDKPKLGSLCGGGRYDSLPAVYGRSDLGATGVAGGVERAVLACKFAKEEAKTIFVAPVGKEAKLVRIAASIAADLRSSGMSAQSEIAERSLRKILEIQSELGTEAVIIVGERELNEKSVKIRWMKSGDEVKVSLSELQSTLRKRL
jgi:histidyl-tRNA synthetase